MKNIVRLLGCVFFIFLLNGCSQADRTSNFNDTDGNSQVTENSNSKKNSQKDTAKQTELNKLTFAGQAIKENTESLNDQKLELHIGDKLIESFKTDKDGYLFTHLIVDQTYRLSGKDFEVTVTAKSDDDIQVKETKGSLLLGRTIKSKQGEIELLSSTIYFDKKKDSYTLSEDKKTLIVDETLNIEAGDKILLSPDTENLGGLGVEVVEKEEKKEQTVLTVDQVQANQVLENTQYNGTVNVSEGKFTPAEGVELVKQKARNATLNVKTKIGSEKSPIKGEIELKLDGVVETDVDVDFLNLEASTIVVKPKLKTEISTGIVVKGKIETDKNQFPLGTLEIPTGGPTTIKFVIYVHAELDGKLEIRYKLVNSFEAEAGYRDGNLVHTASAKVLDKEEVFDVKGELTAKVGPKLATTVNGLLCQYSEQKKAKELLNAH
ncbi:hypothetical protein [Enterococcus wangshanyuanii]|uniref:Lipoprotein n=1 Tax=Enterococcus wangshanyuanii TaxID=2005703 RepID=A0ABQ1PM56_9ENTE|nr:hypothetical protein [Enterococcus wangshanyuanii]GGC99422.1 hypothetical protein GCM10011573_31250 [Enterococcus wangshanyuanii]